MGHSCPDTRAFACGSAQAPARTGQTSGTVTTGSPVGCAEPLPGSTVTATDAAESSAGITEPPGGGMVSALIVPADRGAPDSGTNHIWYTCPAGGGGTSVIDTTTAFSSSDALSVIVPPATSAMTVCTSGLAMTWSTVGTVGSGQAELPDPHRHRNTDHDDGGSRRQHTNHPAPPAGQFVGADGG